MRKLRKILCDFDFYVQLHKTYYCTCYVKINHISLNNELKCGYKYDIVNSVLYTRIRREYLDK